MQLTTIYASPDYPTNYYRYTYPMRVETFGYRIRTVSFYNEYGVGEYNSSIDLEYNVLCRHGTADHVDFVLFRDKQHINPTALGYHTNIDFYIIG